MTTPSRHLDESTPLFLDGHPSVIGAASMSREQADRALVAQLQRGDAVAFFGTMLPDAGVADRLIQAQAGLSDDELARQALSTPERQAWQRDCNLRILVANAGD